MEKKLQFKDFTAEVKEFDQLPFAKQQAKVEAMVKLLVSKNEKFERVAKNYESWKHLPGYNRMLYIRILRRGDFVKVYHKLTK